MFSPAYSISEEHATNFEKQVVLGSALTSGEHHHRTSETLRLPVDCTACCQLGFEAIPLHSLIFYRRNAENRMRAERNLGTQLGSKN